MTEQGWQRTAATAVIGGAVAFLWCFADLLAKVQTSEITWNPPTQGELYKCIVYALLAIGAACKLDLPLFGRGLAQTLNTVMGKLGGQQ